jgi:Ni/Co efflux regulator RcnB
MRKLLLPAVLAMSSTLAGPAFAQSSDIRQAEQDRAAQRQRELQERPQYLPGDRQIVEEAQRQERQRVENERRADQRRNDAAARARAEPPRHRDERPVWRESEDRRMERGRGFGRDDRDRDDRGRGYSRDAREGEWRGNGRGGGPNRDWYRGSHLPREYRSHYYVVDDWRGHRLSAPPRGYHWVQAGGDYALVAIATGLIATILLSQ